MNERLTGPKVLALVSDATGPTLWRIWQPFAALQKAGYQSADWDYKDNPLIGSIAPDYDGYVLPRISWLPEHRRVAESWFQSIRAAGKFVVFEADDDIFTAHETERRIELDWCEGKSPAQLNAERHERIWALQQCDGVTVSTQRLATIVRSYTGKPVIVVPNAIDLKWFQAVVRGSKRQIPGLTIGWAGGRRHDRDVEDMAVAWGRIAARYPDVSFVVQGHYPQVILDSVPMDRLKLLPWMMPEVYPVGIRQVDIGCCAVSSTPFNRAKSNIKAMEYAAAGSAVVASPTLYSSIISHGDTGLLAESVDDWEACLDRLISSPATRSMMARRLLRTVERKHSLAGNLHRWTAAWSQIQASARSARGILKLA